MYFISSSTSASYRATPSLLGYRNPDPVRSVFTLTLICQCERMFNERFRAVSPCCDSFAASVDQSADLLWRHWLCHLCKHDLITAVLRWLGLPRILLHMLQSVLNAAARLVHCARRNDHITPRLRDLHWLRVPERIAFRLAVLVYRCQHEIGPSYLAAELHRVAMWNRVAGFVLRLRRRWLFHTQRIRRSAIEHSR